MAQPLLNVTELDFDQIKANLRAYFLRQDSPIKDWNYDGSGLNMLLDVLAYNTHYNAILAHLNLNESFIDTAQLRSSVISQAKLLGYIPGSIKASTVNVYCAFSSSGSPIAGSSITIPAGAKFSGTGPNGSFTFVTQAAQSINYVTSQSSYITYLPLIQGVYRTQTYQVDNTLANQKFTIDDPSADISTLTVNVYENQNVSSKTSSTPYLEITDFIANKDISNVKGTSEIYYLSLNSNGTYEVTFGDGIIGNALNNLNVVQLRYVSTQGVVANGLSTFTYADSTLISSDSLQTLAPVVTTLNYSAGGADQESIDSIRLNAPASLIAQNRAVTANDYIALLQKKNASITSANVWGGEDEVTYDPVNAAKYAGKVFISYTSSTALTSSTVIDNLKPFKVMSVMPIYYAPDYVLLYLTVNFKYNPNLTTKDASELTTNGTNVVIAYNSASLQNFTGVFRHSNLLRQIDTSDPSILNSDIQVSFYKNYVVNALTSPSDVATLGIGATNAPNGLVSTFGNTLYGSTNQVNSMVTSSGFTLSSVLMPAQTPIQVYGTYSSASYSIILSSSPGTSTLSTNALTHPYLVVGALVSSSATTNSGISVTASGFSTGTYSIVSINNTGSYSIITLNGSASLSWLTSSAVTYSTLTITPPSGAYYLKDGDDPTSSTTRRLFMSRNSSSTVAASDPKYTSTGSDIHIGTVYPSTGKIELYRYFSGAATSQPIAGFSLQDNSYGGQGAWYTNQFAGCVLYITAGQGATSSVAITTNSANTLYWSTPSITIDSTSQYVLIRSCIDTDTTTAGTNITINSRPASNDVAPSRNQLLAIDMNKTAVTATADSFAQAGVLGAYNYTTFSRDPQS